MIRLIAFLSFIPFYIVEIVRSNFRVAKDALAIGEPKLSPGVICLDVSDYTDRQTAIMANLITMTPGTLGMLVSDDHEKLYIHTMYIDGTPEELESDLCNTYGKRVRDVF